MILLQRFPEKVVPNKHVVPNNCRELETFWKKKPGKEDGYSGMNRIWMNENSIWLFYYIYLLYKNFRIYVIYAKEGVCYI